MVPANEPGVPRVFGYVQVCMVDGEFDSFTEEVSLNLAAPTPCLAAIHRSIYACAGASPVSIAFFYCQGCQGPLCSMAECQICVHQNVVILTGQT